MSGRSVLFVDGRETLAAAQRRLGGDFLRSEKVALTPEACHLLDTAGIPYRTPEEFYDVADLWKIEAETIERLYRWCDRVDALLNEQLPEIGLLGLRPARYNIYMWYLLINTLASRQHALERTLATLAPEQIYIPGLVHDRITRDLYFLYESIDVHLLQALSATRVIGCQAVSRRGSPRVGRQDALRNLVRWAYRLSLRWLRPLPAMPKGRQVRSAPGTPVLWVLWPGYDAVPVVSEAKRRGTFRIMEWVPADMLRHGRPARRNTASIWQRVRSDRGLCEPLRQDGIDWMPILEPRLQYFFDRCVPETIQLAQATTDFVTSTGPVVILKANEMDYRDLCVTDVALRHGVPVVMYQHGGAVGYCGRHPLMPLAHWGTGKEEGYFFLTYGNGVSAYCEQARAGYPALAAQPIAVGSTALEETARNHPSRGNACRRLGVNPNHAVVVYAPTGYYGHVQYPMLYRDTEYFNLQRRVVELFAKVGRHQYVVKRFPWGLVGLKDPLPDVVRSLDTPAIRVVEAVPFSEAMWAADLLVVDFPSTTLLQALVSRKPIMVLADSRHMQLSSEARALLERRVTISESADEFLAALETALLAGEFRDLPEPDESFLRSYGTHLGDGRSAVRVHDFLLELARNGRAKDSG